MSIDKLKRVVWRLNEMKTSQPGVYTTKQIRLAIMEEIGTDERTIKEVTKKLIELKLIIHEGIGMMKINKEGAYA